MAAVQKQVFLVNAATLQNAHAENLEIGSYKYCLVKIFNLLRQARLNAFHTIVK